MLSGCYGTMKSAFSTANASNRRISSLRDAARSENTMLISTIWIRTLGTASRCFQLLQMST